MTSRSDAVPGGIGGFGDFASLGPTKVSCVHAVWTDSFRASNLKLPPLPPIPPNLAFYGSPNAGSAVQP